MGYCARRTLGVADPHDRDVKVLKLDAASVIRPVGILMLMSAKCRREGSSPCSEVPEATEPMVRLVCVPWVRFSCCLRVIAGIFAIP